MLKKLLSFLLCYSLLSLSYANDYTSPITFNDGSSHDLISNDTVTLDGLTPGAALQVSNSGTILNVPHVQVTTQAANGYGANVMNSGTLNLSDSTTIATTGTTAHGINLSNGGTLTTQSDSALSTTGDNANGIKAVDSSINLSTGGITTTGQNAMAILLSGTDTIFTGTGLNITTGNASNSLLGSGSTGLQVTENSQATLSGSGVTTWGSGAYAAQAKTGGQLTLSNLSLTTNNSNATGLVVTDADTSVTGDNFSIVTNGANSNGAQVSNDGHLTLSNMGIETHGATAVGLSATDGNTSVSLSNLTITTDTNDSHAIQAQNSAEITGDSLTIGTAGNNSNGIQAENGAHIALTSNNGGTGVATTGSNATALSATNSGTFLTVTGAALSTQGASSNGVQVTNQAIVSLIDDSINTLQANANGLLATAAGTQFTGDSLTINTIGANSNGIQVENGANVTLTSNLASTAITTTDSNAVGLLATDSGTVLTSTGSTVLTQGAGSHGVQVATGATASLTHDSITTQQASTYGLFATDTNTSVTGDSLTINTTDSNGIQAENAAHITLTSNLTPTHVTTAGSNAAGLSATGANTFLESTGAIILTQGTNSNGVQIADGATTSLTNASISTSGTGSNGMLVQSGATATLTGGTVTKQNSGLSNAALLATGANTSLTTHGLSILATGDYNNGVLAADQAQVTLADGTTVTMESIGSNGLIASGTGVSLTANQTTVHMHGTGSIGMIVDDGATATLTGSTISTTETNANALSLWSTGQTVTIDSSQLTAAQSDAIIAQGFTGTLNLQNQTNVSAGNNAPFLSVITDMTNTPSNMTLNAGNQVHLIGDIVVEAGNTLNSTLSNQSTWTGLANNVTNLTLNQSQWSMTGPSTITTVLNNNGTIISSPSSPGTFQTLTTTDYQGDSNSSLTLNTQLGTDNSPSDQLIIAGNATGNTTLHIQNVNGQGAMTQQNGIPVVIPAAIRIKDSRTIASDVFSLEQPILVGPYEYKLYQGSLDGSDSEGFYLRSMLTDIIPDYRPATSLYTALPSMELLYGRMLLNTLHPNIPNTDHDTLPNNPLVAEGTSLYAYHPWIKVSGQGGHIYNGGIFENGPDFNYHFVALQAGSALYHELHHGHLDDAGLYGVIGHGSGTVTDYNGVEAGHNRFDVYTVGGYWTHISPNHSYIEALLQENFYDASANSPNTTLQPHYHAFNASLAGGYPFPLTKGYTIEPEAQVIYQNLSSASGYDQVSLVQFNRTESIAGRIGLRLAKTWALETLTGDRPNQLTTWIRANRWHEAKGNSVTQFSSDAGLVPFNSKLAGDWTEASIGINGKISAYASVYGTLSYAIDDHTSSKAYYATLGLRLNAR